MRIFVGAGEASGDRMLAPVLRSLRAHLSAAGETLEVHGFGGPLCETEGLLSLVPIERLAVNGIGDVLRHAPFLLRTRARLRHTLRATHPDRVLLADYPGMNVGLAREALRLGIPVHYIAPPQLWAYRNPSRRLGRLRAALDGASLQVLFPFEAQIYEPWSGSLSQGHFFDAPAADAPRGERLLLCPGSRPGVMRRNLPLWLRHLAAAGFAMDTVEILVPPPFAEEAHAIAGGIIGHRVPAGTSIHPRRRGHSATGGCIEVTDDPPAAFARARAAIAFPGTVTLELLLSRIPTQVWGVLDPLTLWAGRRMLRGPHVALANLLAPHDAFPEWIGTAADFRRTPPSLPDMQSPEAVDPEIVQAVWKKMGECTGTDTAVKICMESCLRETRKGK